MLGSSTLRMELLLFNPVVITAQTRRDVQRILERPTPLDVSHVLRISPVAGALLTWLRRVLRDEPTQKQSGAAQRAPDSIVRHAVDGSPEELPEIEEQTVEAVEEPIRPSQKSDELDEIDDATLIQGTNEATTHREELEKKLEGFWTSTKSVSLLHEQSVDAAERCCMRSHTANWGNASIVQDSFFEDILTFGFLTFSD